MVRPRWHTLATGQEQCVLGEFSFQGPEERICFHFAIARCFCKYVWNKLILFKINICSFIKWLMLTFLKGLSHRKVFQISFKFGVHLS